MQRRHTIRALQGVQAYGIIMGSCMEDGDFRMCQHQAFLASTFAIEGSGDQVVEVRAYA